jgi:hypothetical protein
MDVNEELLLHVFGSKVPTGYELGLYNGGSSTLTLAVAQSDKLVQV